MSESWGCEFLDDDNFGSQFDNTVGPGQDLRFLPMSLVAQATDKNYLVEIRNNDSEYIQEIASSIQAVGFLEAGILTYDHQSIRLSDGNHRFLAAEILGLKEFPVELVQVDTLKARSARINNFLNLILEMLIWQEK